MSEYINYGKATIYRNEDSNEQNKRPHFSGTIEITEEIPKGTKLRLAGWENLQGTKVKSIGFNLSSKADEAGANQVSSKNDEDLPF